MYVNICMIHMYDGSNAQWSMQQQTDKYQINMCVHSISKFSSKHLLGVFEWTSNVPPQTAMCPYPWMPWVSLYTTVQPPTRFYIIKHFSKGNSHFCRTHPPTHEIKTTSFQICSIFLYLSLWGVPPLTDGFHNNFFTPPLRFWRRTQILFRKRRFILSVKATLLLIFAALVITNSCFYFVPVS